MLEKREMVSMRKKNCNTESETMNQSTSGAGGVENPEQLKLIFYCLGSS